LLLYLDSKPM